MRLSLVLLCFLVSDAYYAVNGANSNNKNKDDAYYPSGMMNPNVNEKMYWEDADGVVADINQFDTLYVTHHGCA